MAWGTSRPRASGADPEHLTRGRGTHPLLAHPGLPQTGPLYRTTHAVIEAFIVLANAIIVTLRLLRDAWTTHSWDTCQTPTMTKIAYWRNFLGGNLLPVAAQICGAAPGGLGRLVVGLLPHQNHSMARCVHLQEFFGPRR